MQSGAHFLRWYLHAAQAWVALLPFLGVEILLLVLLLLGLLLFMAFWGGTKKGV